MTTDNELPANTLYIEVTGAGLPEVDGLYVPSTEPPKESESGTLSSLGYWNGRMAWTVQMESLPEVPLCRTQTATNRGASVGSTATLLTTIPVKMSSRQLIGNGMFIKWE